MKQRTERSPTTINFHREVYEQLKRAARREDASLTELVERIVKDYLEVKARG